MRRPFTLKDIRPIVPISDIKSLLTAEEYRKFFRYIRDLEADQPPNAVYASHLITWIKRQA